MPDQPAASVPPALPAPANSSSILIKIVIISFLALLLLIPTLQLQGLIEEREQYRAEAVSDVTRMWGAGQTISGPFISVPYKTDSTGLAGRPATRIAYAHFFPETLSITGTIRPEQRSRGIFDVILYNTRLTVSSTFRKPSATSVGLPDGVLQWDKAILSLGISDLKGVRQSIRVRVNGQSTLAEPGLPTNDVVSSGVIVPIRLDADQYRVSTTLDLNGSTQLDMLPLGRETRVSLQSSWASPGFVGAFLPDQRVLDTSGFRASWTVLQLNRDMPQQGLGSFLTKRLIAAGAPIRLGNTPNLPTFGVKLMLPIDEYQKTTRATKYGLLFILLTFITFFGIEILAHRAIHPVQYLLVGLAICLFYLLLLAFSEQITFNRSYLLSSLLIVGLITGYVRYVFRSPRLTMAFGLLLAVLYAFFFGLLQLTDYALLLGSLGLLTILAAGMYATRHVDWYGVRA